MLGHSGQPFRAKGGQLKGGVGPPAALSRGDYARIERNRPIRSDLNRFRHPPKIDFLLGSDAIVSRIRHDSDSDSTDLTQVRQGGYASEEKEGRYEPVGMLRRSLQAAACR